MSAPAWLREDGDAVVLTLHLQPGASATRPAGAHGEALKLRLAAPAIEGRANDALRRYLAEAFAVPLRNVVIERGETSRRKVVRVASPSRRPEWASLLPLPHSGRGLG